MDRINPATLEMEGKAFYWAMMKLSIMGLINGFSWKPPSADSPEKMIVFSRSYLLPTREGIEKAAAMAGTAKDRRSTAMQKVYEIFRDIGSSTFAGLIARQFGL